MTIELLMNRPCVITRRGPAVADDDPYGNEGVEIETGVTTVCELQQGSSASAGRQEITTRGQIVTGAWTLFLPAGTAIDAGDTVTVDDAAFEVDGDPWLVRNPRTQAAHHVEAVLVRTTGSSQGPV